MYPYFAVEDFCVTGSGTTPSRANPSYYDGGTIPWVKSGELRENIILDTEEKVTEIALKETSLKRIPADAILVALYGATVGRSAILGIEATTNQAVCHIIPHKDLADTRYLFHSLQFKVPELISRAVGGAQPNISQATIKKLKIPLPPLPEQRRIAAVLDAADALRAKRRAALAKLDTLLQAVFLEMFGDPVRNEKGWEESNLDDACSKITDGTHNSPPIVEQGIPYITAKHIRNGRIEFFNNPWYISEENHESIYKRCDPIPGDVLYIKDGVTTGMAALNEYDFEFSMLSSLALLRPNSEKVLPIYLRDWLMSTVTKNSPIMAR